MLPAFAIQFGKIVCESCGNNLHLVFDGKWMALYNLVEADPNRMVLRRHECKAKENPPSVWPLADRIIEAMGKYPLGMNDEALYDSVSKGVSRDVYRSAMIELLQTEVVMVRGLTISHPFRPIYTLRERVKPDV